MARKSMTNFLTWSKGLYTFSTPLPLSQLIPQSLNPAGVKNCSLLFFCLFFSLPAIFQSLFYHFFSADFPCFLAVRCFGHTENRESRKNRHLKNFLGLSGCAALCRKLERSRLHNRCVFSSLSFWRVMTTFEGLAV